MEKEVTKMAGQGRGWHGDSEGHKQAGQKGGRAPHKTRGLAAASAETRRKVARKGGQASH